jgi:hypothetical protein
LRAPTPATRQTPRMVKNAIDFRRPPDLMLPASRLQG